MLTGAALGEEVDGGEVGERANDGSVGEERWRRCARVLDEMCVFLFCEILRQEEQ
ncbi:hypothetical protein HanRHA438_Chr04g0172211 [Helianthus annuus]|nr:hypothetical protein HanIR_Chr04g0175211 [Helianthus annuus]KAJ0926527.1 hypothetical protein HanRHA438_Chr04g0172211 [Helianthus annuus]